MHRNRTWQLDPTELRTQRNRILPIEGGDGAALSLDFTTGILDPRLAFTRTGNATFINSSGYVQWADANMIAQSETFSGSPWGVAAALTVASATTTNPIGGTTATSVTLNATTNSAGLNALPSHAIGIPYVFRIWVKGNTTTKISIGLLSSGSWVTNVTVTAVAGFTGVTIAGSTYRNITNLSTTQWTQLEMKYTAATTGSDYVYLYPATPSPQTIGDSLYLWGAQLNPGTTACPYYTTTASAYQAPRFDYDPTTLAPRGLLIEGSAANLVFRSQSINTSPWNRASVTVSETGSGSPANDATSNVITWTNGTAVGSAYAEQPGISVSASQPYTWSVWLKNRGNQRVSVFGYTKTSASGFAGNLEMTVDFSVATPTASITTSTNFTNTSVTTPVACGNGWYRCTMTGTTPSTAATTGFGISNKDAVPASGTNGCEAWGAQLEAGSGASSYIPTGASQGSRAADKMSMNDITTMQWNQTAGTFALHMDVAAETNTSSFPTFMGMYTATPVRVFRFLLNNSSGLYPRIGNDTWTATPTQILSSLVTRSTAPTAFKFAVSLSNTGQTVNQVVNAGSVTTTSGTGTMQTPTRVLWHQDPSAGDSEYFPIHIRSLKYWNTALPNAQLQSITT